MEEQEFIDTQSRNQGGRLRLGSFARGSGEWRWDEITLLRVFLSQEGIANPWTSIVSQLGSVHIPWVSMSPKGRSIARSIRRQSHRSGWWGWESIGWRQMYWYASGIWWAKLLFAGPLIPKNWWLRELWSVFHWGVTPKPSCRQGQLIAFRLLDKGLEYYDKAMESRNGSFINLKMYNASKYETILGVAMNNVPARESYWQ